MSFPPVIMLIRHGEKPVPDGKDIGVTSEGKPSEHALTVRGWQRAGALVALFGSHGPPPGLRLRRPAHLYAAGVTELNKGKRAKETLGPLAGYLEIELDTHFTIGQEAALAEHILTRDEPVLVAWEHKNLTIIAATILRQTPEQAPKWPSDRFDLVWVFTRDASERYSFSVVPQLLLGGDKTFDEEI